jgi:hypothetical protein
MSHDGSPRVQPFPFIDPEAKMALHKARVIQGCHRTIDKSSVEYDVNVCFVPSNP